jgi:MFS family permease
MNFNADQGPRVVNKWLITIAVMAGTFMEIIDTTVVNVALPHMAGSLSAGVDEATWVLTSYLVSNAIILPITGWLSALFGRKRFLMICLFLFTGSSMLCGSAPNLESLILFRVFQGIGGGAAAHLPGHFTGELSGARTGHGHGHLGHRGGLRAHHRSPVGGVDHG